MKILIKENNLKPVIKSFIMDKFPNKIYDVYYTSKQVQLGTQKNSITRNIINVVIDNSDTDLRWAEFRELKEEIIESVDSFFGLDVWGYGTEWDFQFLQLTIVPIDA